MKKATFAAKQFQYDNADSDSWTIQYNRWNKARRMQKGIATNDNKALKSQWQGMANERCAY